MLQDRDARTAMPTTAQVHYDTVKQLQVKPKARLETRNISTSMGKDDFPHCEFQFQVFTLKMCDLCFFG